MSAPSFSDDAHQAAEVHLQNYTSHFHSCLEKLKSIWKQIGKSPDECRSQVLVAAEQALAAWSQAVDRAEAERQSIKALIQQHSAEIASIKAELDDRAEQAPEAEANIPGEGESTLQRTLDALKGTLQFWRVKRASRMQAYQALMEVHVSLKQQLGQRHSPAQVADISGEALEYLQMENMKLREEKAKRMARAEGLLDRLRGICRELGEDSAAAAAEVHPALCSLSVEKESAEVLGCVYKLAAASSPHASDLAGGGDLDLSDATFDRLGVKIGEMERLKVEREAQSRDVLEMLGSLWSALSIPEDAPERSMVLKTLAADRPQRLYKRTLDKALAEVNRLEGCKAQAMRDLALAKARELEQLCISTRISPPHTGPLLAELDRPGQMTQVLSKLVRLVAEVAAMASKRAPILHQVQELLQAQADSAWLRAYNQNENRYKGRDASRNMQRAIKAAKLRERLGPMLEALRVALAEWELEEGSPFLYDEQVLQETHLRAVEAELEQIALEKTPKLRSSTAGALSASISTSSLTAGMSASASSGGSRPPTANRGMMMPSGSLTQRGGYMGSSRPSSSAGAIAGGAGGGAGEDRPLMSSASVRSQGGDGGNGSGATSSAGGAAGLAARRGSFGYASARDSGVYRSSTTAAMLTNSGMLASSSATQNAGRMLRSNDFASSSLRAVSEATEKAAAAKRSTNSAAQGRAATSHASSVPPATPAAAKTAPSPSPSQQPPETTTTPTALAASTPTPGSKRPPALNIASPAGPNSSAAAGVPAAAAVFSGTPPLRSRAATVDGSSGGAQAVAAVAAGAAPVSGTPPMRSRAATADGSGASYGGAVGGEGGVVVVGSGGASSAVKNSAQDLFRRYLGDTSDAPKPTPPSATSTKTPLSATAASRRPPTTAGNTSCGGGIGSATHTHTVSRIGSAGGSSSKLLFSATASTAAAVPPAAHGVSSTTTAPPLEDDGTDDVVRDTPKSTATSRSHHQNIHPLQTGQVQGVVAAGGVLSPPSQGKMKSPAERTSRIPKMRA
ncbi:hypothetical protein Agub_g13923 [Astrephomene gubernaculifera]|uniref:Uncharacterized protein n=1 Tax=Astrephomene gubernaculifera TaxID=47775 RepID=A0AAD3E113_9CHLO|nr:hypothetical protein Agub_g13923 [Astrephomene gubernaculifera]